MANFVYNYAKLKLATGQIDLDTDDIRAILIMTGTTVNNDELEFVGSISGANLKEFDGAGYVRKSLTESVAVDLPNNRAEFDAVDVTWTALSAGTAQVIAVVLYKHVTNDANSPLLLYIDTATGLPVTPNGGDLQITWNAEGIIQFT